MAVNPTPTPLSPNFCERIRVYSDMEEGCLEADGLSYANGNGVFDVEDLPKTPKDHFEFFSTTGMNSGNYHNIMMEEGETPGGLEKPFELTIAGAIAGTVGGVVVAGLFIFRLSKTSGSNQMGMQGFNRVGASANILGAIIVGLGAAVLCGWFGSKIETSVREYLSLPSVII